MVVQCGCAIGLYSFGLLTRMLFGQQVSLGQVRVLGRPSCEPQGVGAIGWSQ